MLTSLLLPALLVSMPHGMDRSAAAEAEHQITQVQAELEDLRRRLNQSGAEKQLDREKAVGSLLLMRDPDAHRILQEALQRPADPGLRLYILDELAKRWAQPQDPVFGTAGDDEGATARRMQLLRDYTRVFVPFVQSATGEQADSPARALEEEVITCLRDAIAQQEARAILTGLIEGTDPEKEPGLLTSAIYVALRTEDMQMIPVVAPFLDHEVLGQPTRDALQEMLYLDRPFASREDLDGWWDENGSKTYFAVTREAAREKTRRLRDIAAGYEQRLRARGQQLVRAHALTDPVAWSELQSLVFADQLPPAEQQAYLETLQVALRQAVQRRPELGGDLAARRRFEAGLHLAWSESRDLRRGPLLECLAYVSQSEDPAESRERTQLALQSGLATPVVAGERTAALRGIVRFPSKPNFGAVLDAAAQIHADGDREGLSTVLAVLASSVWGRPDGSREDRLVEFLGGVLRDPELGVELKDAALNQISRAGDSEDLAARWFGILANDVLPAERGQPRPVRLRSMGVLYDLMGSRSVEYSQLVVGLFADPDVEVRKRAANWAKNLSSSQLDAEAQEEWARLVVVRASQALETERDPGVVHELVRCMVDLTGAPKSNSVGRLAALADFASTADPQRPALEQELVEGLLEIGTTPGVEGGVWTNVGQALLRLGRRDAVRAILAGQDLASLAQDRQSPQTQVAMELVVGAAALRTVGGAWDPGEAQQVVDAFAILSEGVAGEALATSRSRTLRVAALVELGSWDAVVQHGGAALADAAVPLEPGELQLVRNGMVRAHLEAGKLKEAEDLLPEFQRSERAEVSLLRLDLAERYVRSTPPSGSAAIRVVQPILDLGDARFGPSRQAFLIRADARLLEEGTGAEVFQALQERADWFDESVEKGLRDRYAALVERAGNS